MYHLLKLGPVQLSQANTNVYLRVTATGDFAPPVFEQDDEAGMQALLEGVAPADVSCEPTLAEAAERLGLRVESPPLKVLSARAAIGTFMAWEQRGVAGLGADKALLFVQAATEFWEARPWTHWDDSQPFQVTVSGAFSRAYEGSVFGGEEGGEGLALYEQSGALKVLMDLQGSGKDASQLPAIGVTLDTRPEYAIQALAAAGRGTRTAAAAQDGALGHLHALPGGVAGAGGHAAGRRSPGSTRREALSTVVAGRSRCRPVLAPQPRVRN